MKKWKTHSSQPAFQHKWFTVQRDAVELGNGKILDDYFYYLHGDVAMVIAFTENNDIVLTKQYRHALGDFYLELPAGVVDPGEDPKAAAIRELAEETGYGADHFELLAKLAPSPGKIKGVWHVYLALKASKRYEVQLDPSEEIEVSAVPASEVLQMIRHGEITADTTIAPVYMACEKLGLLRK